MWYFLIFLVHMSQSLKRTIEIMCCPYLVNFHIFDFLETADKTWQEASTRHPLPSLCCSGQFINHDGHPDLWLAEIFFTFPL